MSKRIVTLQVTIKQDFQSKAGFSLAFVELREPEGFTEPKSDT